MSKSFIVVAPDLPSEVWWSMDYYKRIFQKEIEKLSGQFDFKMALPVPGRMRLWDRHVAYPAKIRELIHSNTKNGLLHILDHSYGHLCRSDINCVVSCHDLAEWRKRTLPSMQHWWWKSRVRQLSKARHCFALSQSTSNDLQEFLGIEKDKITVNPFGVDEVFKPMVMTEELFKTNSRLQCLRDLKEKGFSLILHVGSNIDRKNVITLLRAVSLLKRKNRSVVLVKVGDSLFKSRWSKWIVDQGLESSIIEFGPLSFEDLHPIYAYTDVLSFPSTYEGQGLPVLESQACGLPCVISNSTSLVEVGGDSVLYHDPMDPEELMSWIERVLDSSDLRQDLIRKGCENVKRFTWDVHFNRVVLVYQNFLGD